MLPLHLQPESHVPLYVQLRDQLRALVHAGDLRPGNGIRWELLFADERGEEVLSRLTASAPEDALSFVMARPAQEYFPIEELQSCVNAVLRREATDVLNLGPSDGYAPLKE